LEVNELDRVLLARLPEARECLILEPHSDIRSSVRETSVPVPIRFRALELLQREPSVRGTTEPSVNVRGPCARPWPELAPLPAANSGQRIVVSSCESVGVDDQTRAQRIGLDGENGLELLDGAVESASVVQDGSPIRRDDLRERIELTGAFAFGERLV